ncbi:MAG TPA: hypothetical protein VMV29_15015 [Ktedonobacterales bacterium]|nr:hypothetical protein [Ktedonobacterales bacterium]
MAPPHSQTPLAHARDAPTPPANGASQRRQGKRELPAWDHATA